MKRHRSWREGVRREVRNATGYRAGTGDHARRARPSCSLPAAIGAQHQNLATASEEAQALASTRHPRPRMRFRTMTWEPLYSTTSATTRTWWPEVRRLPGAGVRTQADIRAVWGPSRLLPRR